MRCYSCSKLSFNILCKTCKKELFTPNIKVRHLSDLDVISFFRYSTLESLLHTKHKPEGYRIYKSLAEITMKPFIAKFIENMDDIYIVGIDENVRSGYSHIALLTHAMKMKNVIIQHSSLLATNKINYSGKSLLFRLGNPRSFKYNGKRDINVILVDDIITTGTTLKEAQQVLIKNNINVLFALTLADVKE